MDDTNTPGAPGDPYHLIEFPVCSDDRGRLTAIHGQAEVPFPIRRAYYLYDVPSGASRAGHAHYELEEVLIALSGSFTVSVDDGHNRASFTLNMPFQGLFTGPLVWREIENFSSGAVCLALASTAFDEGDYIRDFEDFMRITTECREG
jgi:hypothetical protein